jgi:hypothetical protein
MPEVGLGIGCEQGNQGGWQREWVYWYDRSGVRYPTAEERADNAQELALQERAAKEEAVALVLQERQQKEKLAAYLKTLGINPDEIP